MIKLYGFGQGFGVVDPSPFVVKVDLFLKLAELPFVTDANAGHLETAPKSKLPYIVDGNTKLGDSHFILEFITEKYQLTLDDHLTDEQKAQASLYTKAIDEGLYWCLVYSRWVHEPTWQIIKESFFSKLPIPLKWFLPGTIQKDVKKTLHRQGYGRHTLEELIAKADDIFSSLSAMLADNPYFFGEKPSSFDAVAYSILCEFITVSYDTPFNDKARGYENLVAYCQRIESEYYN